MHKTSETVKNKSKKYKNISLTSLGWELALPIFGGVFIGYQLDQILVKSRYFFTISFLVFGIVVGYYNLYKLIDLEMLRNKKEKRNLKDRGEA
jgi:F0F1-type ATP synthase assembly protein I